MSQHDEDDDPRLNEEDRRSLARMRRAVAEAEAAGRWQTEPPFDTDKFDGPFGVDAEGNVLAYDSVQEARAAAAERDRRRRTAGDDPEDDEHEDDEHEDDEHEDAAAEPTDGES